MKLFNLFTIPDKYDEIVLGELVHQNGTWEQNGVVLLPHVITFHGNLHQVRMRIRNTNPIWIQVWTLTDTVPKFLNLTMTSQWEYTPTEIAEVSVSTLKTTSRAYPQLSVRGVQKFRGLTFHGFFIFLKYFIFQLQKCATMFWVGQNLAIW
jgi:hypothetical protein